MAQEELQGLRDAGERQERLRQLQDQLETAAVPCRLRQAVALDQRLAQGLRRLGVRVAAGRLPREQGEVGDRLLRVVGRA